MKSGLLLILSLFTIHLFAQSKIYTTIQANKKKYPTKDFYFEHVLDRRLNKENIGFGYKSSLTYKHPVDFKKTLPQEFLRFLRSTYPNHSSLNRILLAVNQFELEHIVTGKKLDTGIVKTNFDFYIFRNDSAFFILNSKQILIEVSDHVTTSQPNRMKRIILQSLRNLDTVILKKSPEFAFALKEISDSIRSSSSNVTKNSFIVNDSLTKINNYPSEQFLLLGGTSEFSFANSLNFLNVDLLFQIKKHPRVLLGPSVNYMIYGIYFEGSVPANTVYKSKFVAIGMRLLHQIRKDFFFNFQSLFIYGNENFDHQNYYFQNGVYVKEPSSITTEKLYGGDFNIGLYLIPAKKQNFYAGADLFMRVTTSRLLELATGVKINLGFKF